MTQQKQAYIYALLAVLMWSTVASAFKIALSEFSPELTLLYASVTATFVLFIFYLNDKHTRSIQFKDLKKSAISGLFNPFIYYLILINELFCMLMFHEHILIKVVPHFAFLLISSLIVSFFLLLPCFPLIRICAASSPQGSSSLHQVSGRI